MDAMGLGDFKICRGCIFMFTPKIAEMIQIDEHIFQRGWFNHQLVYFPTGRMC